MQLRILPAVLVLTALNCIACGILPFGGNNRSESPDSDDEFVGETDDGPSFGGVSDIHYGSVLVSEYRFSGQYDDLDNCQVTYRLSYVPSPTADGCAACDDTWTTDFDVDDDGCSGSLNSEDFTLDLGLDVEDSRLWSSNGNGWNPMMTGDLSLDSYDGNAFNGSSGWFDIEAGFEGRDSVQLYWE